MAKLVATESPPHWTKGKGVGLWGSEKEKYSKEKNYFIYFWLCWVFVAAQGLSLVAVSRGYSSCGVQTSHCCGFSCRAWALGALASAVVAFGLSSGAAWAELPCGMWDLLGPGIKLCPLH